MNVELRIEELVLRGFPPGDRRRIADALERELSRLFAERGVPPSLAEDRAIGSLRGGTFEARPGAGPGAAGVQAARALYEQIREPREGRGERP